MTEQLLVGRDISADSKPLKAPTSSSPHALVIGGGVVGLTTAWLLLDQGLRVTVLAKEWASWTDNPRLSSQSAGALWKSLPLECGPNAVLDNLTKSQQWTLETYKVYHSLAAIPVFQKAIELRPCTIVTTCVVDENAVMSEKVDWVKKNISGFRRGQSLFDEYAINTEHADGLADAYEYTAPVINVDIAMGFLMDLVQSKGASLVTGTVKGDLLAQESQMLKKHKADVIVNASGLGAREMAADSTVYGLHGALLRVVNDGSSFPVVNNAIVVSSGRAAKSGGEGAFLLPRQDNILALGTISKATGLAADLTVDSPEVKEMRKACESLLPCLKNAKLDPSYPIVHGTRPQRSAGIRVEREARQADSRIIHSYGHGGAGWSLAFGTAREVVALVGEVFSTVSLVPSAGLSTTISEIPEIERLHQETGSVLQETY